MNLEQTIENSKLNTLTEPLFDFAKGNEEKAKETMADETILSFTSSKDMNLTYSLQELQLLAGEPTVAMDYEQLWYGNKDEGPTISTGFDEDYWTFKMVADTEAESLTPQEAEKTFVDMQVAYVTGTQTDVNFVERRRYSLFVAFEGVLHNLNERLHALTRDYNIQWM